MTIALVITDNFSSILIHVHLCKELTHSIANRFSYVKNVNNTGKKPAIINRRFFNQTITGNYLITYRVNQ